MSGGVATHFLTLPLDVGEWSASPTSHFTLLYSHIRSPKEPPGFHWIGAWGNPVSGLGAVMKKRILDTARSRVQFLRLGAMFSVCLPSIAWRVLGLLFFLFLGRCLSFIRSSFLASLLVLFSILFFDLNAAVGSNSWMYSVQWLDYSWNLNWKEWWEGSERGHSTWTAWPLKMEAIDSPETSVTNYPSALRNMAEERSSRNFTYLSLCGSIKTQKVGLSEAEIKFCIFFFSKTINGR